jgi:hypothetical protein
VIFLINSRDQYVKYWNVYHNRQVEEHLTLVPKKLSSVKVDDYFGVVNMLLHDAILICLIP